MNSAPITTFTTFTTISGRALYSGTTAYERLILGRAGCALCKTTTPSAMQFTHMAAGERLQTARCKSLHF